MRIAPGIEAYGGGGFRVAGVNLSGSILILQDEAVPWPVSRVEGLAPAAFGSILLVRDHVEFVLLGTGEAAAPPSRLVRETLRQAGLGLEVMSTREAVRLYNVLAAEGRRIAAALIAVGAPGPLRA